MRPDRAQVYMEVARVISKRSTCFRLNVGAVLTLDDKIVSTGYNGAPPGEDHCRGNLCPGREGCSRTIHAERNAIYSGPSRLVSGCRRLYITHSPCADCCELIVAEKIAAVYFEHLYRNTSHLEELSKNCSVYWLTPAGYMLTWPEQRVMKLGA